MKPPSTKASIIILIVVILSTSIVVYSNFRDSQPKEQGVVTTGINIENNLANEDVNVDSDGDGLLDWEEFLWGTDPQRFDTDGDGTGDLDEINSDRNPIIAGPNDGNNDLEGDILSRISQSSIEEDSLTNRVAVGFAENYFNSREGSDLTLEQKDYLVNGISEQVIEEISVDPIYSLEQLDTFLTKSEPEKLIAYTDSYLTKQINVIGETIGNYENTNYTNLGNFIVQKSRELMEIETPVLISKEHIELANTYYQLGVAVASFDEEEQDPLYVMLSIGIYRDAQDKIRDINSIIGNFLQDNGIIIGDNGIKIENE
jgi:hypothetical protein